MEILNPPMEIPWIVRVMGLSTNQQRICHCLQGIWLIGNVMGISCLFSSGSLFGPEEAREMMEGVMMGFKPT